MSILIENIQNKEAVTDRIESILDQAVRLAFGQEGFEKPAEISCLLVDDEQIREINKEHRNLDKPTDVLSFPMVEMVNGQLVSDLGDYDMDEKLLLLGDIVISLETAQRQAAEYGHSYERELAFLATHGIFHLLGYDHMTEEDEKRMFAKQEAVLELMGLTRKSVEN